MTALEQASKNFEKNYTNRYQQYGWVCNYNQMKFTKISADKGIGAILLILQAHPGLKFDEIRTYRQKAVAHETVSGMVNAGLIKNIRGKGYFCTDLGLQAIAENLTCNAQQ